MTDNMNTADLVKRLRDWTEYDEGKVNDTRHEAADRIEQLEAELTRANAATAAAYEAMASEFDSLGNVGLVVATGIRALATPDQTAALDKLIAEAEARVWEKAAVVASRYNSGRGSGSATARAVVSAILSASKKGGV